MFVCFLDLKLNTKIGTAEEIIHPFLLMKCIRKKVLEEK